MSPVSSSVSSSFEDTLMQVHSAIVVITAAGNKKRLDLSLYKMQLYKQFQKTKRIMEKTSIAEKTFSTTEHK